MLHKVTHLDKHISHANHIFCSTLKTEGSTLGYLAVSGESQNCQFTPITMKWSLRGQLIQPATKMHSMHKAFNVFYPNPFLEISRNKKNLHLGITVEYKLPQSESYKVLGWQVKKI